MMHVKYKLDRSNHHGIGLFADEEIQEGALIYTGSPLLDVNLSQAEFDTLNPSEQHEITYWGFFDEENNVWHVDFDVSKFINHAKEATVAQDDTHKDAYLIATKNIEKGEELTQNYLEFETEEDLRKRGIAV